MLLSTSTSLLRQKNNHTSTVSFIARSFNISPIYQHKSNRTQTETCRVVTNSTSRFSSCATRQSNHEKRDLRSLQLGKPSENFKLRSSPHSLSKSMGLYQLNDTKETNLDEITDIEEIHRNAILHQQSTYIDPPTGFTVFTELAHLKRGKCCGNLCRHCPYGWSNVRGSTDMNTDSAKVASGDKAGSQRLVKKIYDGTYYDEEDERCQNSSNKCESAHDNKTESTPTVIKSEATPALPVARGKGGYAGGTLTSKNVPYTRKGDSGTSQLFTGERRVKNDAVFEALGTVDELSSVVGVVYAELVAPRVKSTPENSNDSIATNVAEVGTNNSAYGELPEQLLEVMSRLLDVGSHIARPAPKINSDNESKEKQQPSGGFHPSHTALLEDWVDNMTEQLPELTSFILPTGSPASAQLHVARTVCRRAERRMVPLVQDEETLDPEALSYVNRLSDYLFTAARYVNYCEGIDELQYRREQRRVAEQGKNEDISLRERVVVKLKENK